MPDVILSILRFLTLPIALLYGLIIALRNYLYDKKVMRSVQLSVPSIAVGNLSVGGSGKTPHIEYLIRLLLGKYEVATLSRGYKRKTQGFRLANDDDSARTLGDEPMQFKLKYPQVHVAVGEDRLMAIPNLMAAEPGTQVVLLDDAFQHRSVQAGLNILLTEFDRPYWRDYIVPFGNLRERTKGAARADIIIVSKCSPQITASEQQEYLQRISPLSRQSVFFTCIDYAKPINAFTNECDLLEGKDVVLIAGIAKPQYLYNYLQERCNSVHLLKYNDHYFYDERDVKDIAETFQNLNSKNKLVLSTEKDATRLMLHRELWQSLGLTFSVLPIQVKFLFDAQAQFDELVLNYMQASIVEEQSHVIDSEPVITYTIVE